LEKQTKEQMSNLLIAKNIVKKYNTAVDNKMGTQQFI